MDAKFKVINSDSNWAFVFYNRVRMNDKEEKYDSEHKTFTNQSVYCITMADGQNVSVAKLNLMETFRLSNTMSTTGRRKSESYRDIPDNHLWWSDGPLEPLVNPPKITRRGHIRDIIVRIVQFSVVYK